ncbi:hypothetical protein PUN4_560031 [Paraburkholderia unamae]|nr:hypothetical protein PUN4_560031 [Paraburkholderia unamae]
MTGAASAQSYGELENIRQSSPKTFGSGTGGSLARQAAAPVRMTAAGHLSILTSAAQWPARGIRQPTATNRVDCGSRNK